MWKAKIVHDHFTNIPWISKARFTFCIGRISLINKHSSCIVCVNKVVPLFSANTFKKEKGKILRLKFVKEV